MKKDYEEIYEEVYNENINELKEIKSKLRKILLIVCIILVLINILIYIIIETKALITISISISAIILIFLFVNSKNMYAKKYKERIIRSMIKKYNSNLDFDPKTGLSVVEYRLSDFDNTFQDFSSEDRISGLLEDGSSLQASEIATAEVKHYKDENGESRTERTETFRGLYGVVKLSRNPLIDVTISANSFMKKYSKKRVEVDSSEFEEYYDCITTDKVKTMEIFTSDLIEKYIDIMNANKKYLFEVKINREILFFRYRCGTLFEPPAVGMGLDKEFMRKYYKLFFYPLEIIEKTIENINNVVDREG